MKIAGIIADNYKIEKFKKELTSHGFTDFEVLPFTPETSTIRVNTTEDRLPELEKICQQVELYFKRRN